MNLFYDCVSLPFDFSSLCSDAIDLSSRYHGKVGNLEPFQREYISSLEKEEGE